MYNERLNQIEELNKRIDYSDLKYTVIRTDEESEFHKEEDPLKFFNDISSGKISVEEAKNL